MRLFFAVTFSDALLDLLARTTAQLRRAAESGSFTHRENFHLTLAFLGEVSPEALGSVADAMNAVRAQPFSLRLGERFGRFGDVYWLDVERSEALTRLQRDLTGALEACGLHPDRKPFKPHLTLARRAVFRPDFDCAAFARALRPAEQAVDGFSLMQSERISGRLVYTQLLRRALP